MTVEWRPVVGHEDSYEVSSDGRVRSIPRERRIRRGAVRRCQGKELKARPDKKGYLSVSLCHGRGRSGNAFVHALVLEAFVGPCPPGQECRHLNGDPARNRLDNLAWGTKGENREDARRHGTLPMGEKHSAAMLTASAVIAIRELAATGLTQRELAARYGISQSNVSLIVRRETWKCAV